MSGEMSTYNGITLYTVIMDTLCAAVMWQGVLHKFNKYVVVFLKEHISVTHDTIQMLFENCVTSNQFQPTNIVIYFYSYFYPAGRPQTRLLTAWDSLLGPT